MSYALDALISNSDEKLSKAELSNCSPLVRQYVTGALSENTRRAYLADLAVFRSWGGSIPCSQEVVAEYLAQHATILSIATLERRLATISKAHRILSLESPTKSELVRATLRGIKRKHARPQRQAKPLIRELLIQVVGAMGNDLRSVRDRALLLIGFAGAFRRSELCQLQVSDIQWLAEGIIVHLKRSKNDQEGCGRQIAIPKGKTNYCPVAALRDWLTRASITEGTIFRRLSGSEKATNHTISGETTSIIIKKRLAAVGYDPKGYSGHSLRAGFATSASAANVSDWKIREQTGHKSAKMLYRYIRLAPNFRASANFRLI